MTIFTRAGVPVSAVKDFSPIPPELELRDRLREISAELDRIWEKL